MKDNSAFSSCKKWEVMTGEYTDWTPLKGRQAIFPEDTDTSDPWQFKNFRVA